jgi:hypothetical protein
MVPATAMQAILRSQVELAAGGNTRAQHAILTAVRAFEQENERDAEMLESMAMLSPVISMLVAKALGREREPDPAEPVSKKSNAAGGTGGE